MSASSPAPIITVRGEAQLEVDPDLASFSLTVHATGESAAAVRSELADASGRVASLVREFGMAIERSSTSGLQVTPVFNRRTATKISGYRGSFDTSVTLHDFDALSPLVVAFSALANCQISGPWWSLSPDNTAYRKVRLDAIAEARRRADDYAAAFGGAVADLLEVSDLEAAFGGGREMRAFAMAKGADESGFEFEPAAQSVSGQVTVRFTMAFPNRG
jgi:uncharacterized protein